MPSWVEFVNAEADQLARLQPPLPKATLRQRMRERLGDAFAYPLELELRALVSSERFGPVSSDGRTAMAGPRFLEVVPEGLTREAAGLTGPFLVKTDRPLQSGSVLRLRVRIEDPRRETPDVPGLHATVLAMDVEVAVEP